MRHKVFQKKDGRRAYAGKIADEQKINKAMLRYYYRAAKMFEAVFRQALRNLPPISKRGSFQYRENRIWKITKFYDS